MNALRSRLELRAVFLKTVEVADSRSATETKALWEELLSFIPSLKRTHKLGKAVPQSFSVKLQRKLASTIPPRPIVQVSLDSAHAHFERLCRDGADCLQVFDYQDSHSLMVCCPLVVLRIGLTIVDFRVLVPIKKAATISLYSNSTTALPIWRYDRTR